MFNWFKKLSVQKKVAILALGSLGVWMSMQPLGERPTPPTVAVASYNQTGGQTAHTINNYTPLDRHVDEEMRKKMVEILKRNPGKIGFASTQGNDEADRFKRKLLGLFKEAGWDASDMSTFMFFNSNTGIVITIPRGATGAGRVQLAAEALNLTGPVSGNQGDMAKDCEIYVQVWGKPH